MEKTLEDFLPEDDERRAARTNGSVSGREKQELVTGFIQDFELPLGQHQVA